MTAGFPVSVFGQFVFAVRVISPSPPNKPSRLLLPASSFGPLRARAPGPNFAPDERAAAEDDVVPDAAYLVDQRIEGPVPAQEAFQVLPVVE